MNYITTTNLRTQSTQLIASLKHGKKVFLIHRSQIIGKIVPTETKTKLFDVKKFRELIKPSKQEKNLSYEERTQTYGEHLKKKYGKNIS